MKNEDNATSSVTKAIKECVLGLVGVNGAPEPGYKEQTFLEAPARFCNLALSVPMFMHC